MVWYGAPEGRGKEQASMFQSWVQSEEEAEASHRGGEEEKHSCSTGRECPVCHEACSRHSTADATVHPDYSCLPLRPLHRLALVTCLTAPTSTG